VDDGNKTPFKTRDMKDVATILKDLDQCGEAIASCPTAASIGTERVRLEVLINELIQDDFHLLVQWLYRIDVDEKKIKASLDRQRGQDAASILAHLIIERQLQKRESRKQFRSSDNIPEEDRW
jgi:hypothetical protein